MEIWGYHKFFICLLVAFKSRAQVVFCFWLTCCQQSACRWVSAIMGTVRGPQSGCCSLWDRGAEDVVVPLPLQLRLLVLQEGVREGKLSFFFSLSSMRQRLWVQVKVNYKFHPWQNPIINFTLSEMPLEVGFALFGMQTDSFACDVFRKTYLLKID